MSAATTGSQSLAPATTPSNNSGASDATTTTNTNSSTTNNNSNNRRGQGRFNGRNRGTSGNFKGAIPSVHTLATKAEKGGIEFVTFTKSLHQHAITTLSNPKDVAVAITDFADPIAHMVPSLPTKRSVQQKLGLYPEGLVANESAEDQSNREEPA